MTDEQTDDKIKFVGEYTGRTVKKGQKGDKEWVKYTLLFKDRPNTQYPKKAGVFDNTLKTILKKEDVTLEEGNYYKVGVVKNYFGDGEKFSWNLTFIKNSTKEDYDKQQEEPKPSLSLESKDKNTKGFDEYLAEFLIDKPQEHHTEAGFGLYVVMKKYESDIHLARQYFSENYHPTVKTERVD